MEQACPARISGSWGSSSTKKSTIRELWYLVPVKYLLLYNNKFRSFKSTLFIIFQFIVFLGNTVSHNYAQIPRSRWWFHRLGFRTLHIPHVPIQRMYLKKKFKTFFFSFCIWLLTQCIRGQNLDREICWALSPSKEKQRVRIRWRRPRRVKGSGHPVTICIAINIIKGIIYATHICC